MVKSRLDEDLLVSQLLELLSGPFADLDFHGPESLSETLLKRSNLRLLWSMRYVRFSSLYSANT